MCEEELLGVIRGMSEEAFREPDDGFASLSPLERLRWLQQTAHFVWRFGGAARRNDATHGESVMSVTVAEPPPGEAGR